MPIGDVAKIYIQFFFFCFVFCFSLLFAFNSEYGFNYSILSLIQTLQTGLAFILFYFGYLRFENKTKLSWYSVFENIFQLNFEIFQVLFCRLKSALSINNKTKQTPKKATNKNQNK